MKYLAEIWRWLTTSRYTRKLEDDLLKAEAKIAGLERDCEGLLGQLYPQLKAIRKEASGEKPEIPHSMNWKVR